MGLRLLLVALSLIVTTACEPISYYAQLANGQWSMLRQRESIETLINNKETDTRLVQRLVLIQQIRQFATEQLALPDNNSYQYFADLQRPFAVWNVFAAPAFSTTAKKWCFPIAGCVSYRGYFSEQEARSYAAQLSAQGYDTYVGGVAAYSTLGWFADPVLNTFLYRDDIRLAGLIFHELAHQKLYLSGDTMFNESFATAVEIEGIKRWVAYQAGNSDADDRDVFTDYEQQQKMREDFVQLILHARIQLEQLYNSGAAEDMMRLEKQRIIKRLVTIDYQDFKLKWAGDNRYDHWMNVNVDPNLNNNAVLNNAKLSTIASYHQWLPAFQVLYQQCEKSLACFYHRAKQLSLLNDSERDQQLHAL
jgi:predicted aminopeptidase